jgi:hypothetical protein
MLKALSNEWAAFSKPRGSVNDADLKMVAHIGDEGPRDWMNGEPAAMVHDL